MSSFKQTLKNFKSQVFSSHQNPIIHNRWVLYLVFFISLANLFYLSVEGDFITVSIFILVGFLTSFFSKNMLVIIFLGLVVSNILKYGTSITKEGFNSKNKNKKQDTKKNADRKKVDTKASKDKDKNKKQNKPKKDDGKDKNKNGKKENFDITESLKDKKQIPTKKDTKHEDKKNKEHKDQEITKLSQNTQKLKSKISNLMSKFNI
jgi:ABC-type multidrug transport system fused ATPase/permease subunit